MKKVKYVALRLSTITAISIAFIFSVKFITQFAVSYGISLQVISAGIIGTVLITFMSYWFSVDYDMKNKNK
jgi:hypothetical protein